jgi:hypothetical protein
MFWWFQRASAKIEGIFVWLLMGVLSSWILAGLMSLVGFFEA